ncbi:hypothetical protein C1646_806432 [Rhizophagus diaphanus]|nr:hypothetical protein C1646_806432 [Rhizophagus diaphanus] [Rhizophagus sp. MUCL 43196]
MRIIYNNLEKFENLSKTIGFGGSASVCTAKWMGTTTTYAIKRFRNSFRDDIINEVYLMGKVNCHPNIIKICGVTTLEEQGSQNESPRDDKQPDNTYSNETPREGSMITLSTKKDPPSINEQYAIAINCLVLFFFITNKIKQEINAWIFYLILLKKKFPDISSCDYLLAQINGGQEIISSIKDKLSHYRSKDLESIIKSALSYLKDKLIYQKSLVFAIDEANVASKKLFDGYFRNHSEKLCGLLTPIVEILNLFKILIVVAGTSFSLKQGSEIQSDIGKDNISEFLIDFKTTESKDVEAYVNRYLNLSEWNIKKIENINILLVVLAWLLVLLRKL